MLRRSSSSLQQNPWSQVKIIFSRIAGAAAAATFTQPKPVLSSRMASNVSNQSTSNSQCIVDGKAAQKQALSSKGGSGNALVFSQHPCGRLSHTGARSMC